jgi:hypothetical protein
MLESIPLSHQEFTILNFRGILTILVIFIREKKHKNGCVSVPVLSKKSEKERFEMESKILCYLSNRV